MSAIANIVLNNGATPSVAKTYQPAMISSDLVRYDDRSGGIILGFPRVSISNRMPNKSAKTYKVTLKIELPVLEQTSASTATGIQPAPTLAYTCLGVVDLVFPERATLAERKDTLAFVKNFLSNAVVQTAVENFEMPY